MKKPFLLAALFLLLNLSACAPQGLQMVDSKDDAVFASMYLAMKPAMQQKHMVDEAGSWYAPLVAMGPDDAGMKLLNSMSPKFCSAELNEPAAKSFRDMTLPHDDVRVGPWSASIRTAVHFIKLQLAAVADWTGDGQEDWLVSCRIGRNSSPSESKEYFLLVAHPEAEVLQPHVLMERQHIYSRVKVLYDNSLSNFLAPMTVEAEQGEAEVTQAPKGERQTFDSARVRTSSLSD